MNLVMSFTVGTTSLLGAEGTPVKLFTDGTVIPCAALSDLPVGILTVGAAVGAPCQVTMLGPCNGGAKVSGTVLKGQFASIGADFVSFTGGTTAGTTYMGYFLRNGVSGDYVPVMVFPADKAG